MSSELKNRQNEMLNSICKTRQRVVVYLMNGVKLVGHVESFDQHMVMLTSMVGMQAVYKHSISTIQADTGKPLAATAARTGSAASRYSGAEQPATILHKRRALTSPRE